MTAQSRARWAFYGQVNSLRMCEGILRSLDTTHGLSDPLLHSRITVALDAITQVRAILMAHKDEWKSAR